MRFLLPTTLFLAASLIAAPNAGADVAPAFPAELKFEVPEKEVEKTEPLPLEAGRFRKEFLLKLRRGTAKRADYDKCKNDLESLTLDEHKRPFYLLLAQYHRSIDRRPVRALELLAPLVVSQETADAWTTEQRAEAFIKFWRDDENIKKDSLYRTLHACSFICVFGVRTCTEQWQ